MKSVSYLGHQGANIMEIKKENHDFLSCNRSYVQTESPSMKGENFEHCFHTLGQV